MPCKDWRVTLLHRMRASDAGTVFKIILHKRACSGKTVEEADILFHGSDPWP
jgi:hypothetical protein